MPLAMYGSLPNSEQLKVFWRAPKDSRKVVVATNIAETSITIPNIVHGELRAYETPSFPFGLSRYQEL